MQTAYPLGVGLSFLQIGQTPGPDTLQLVWAHGWMHSHSTLLPMAQSMEKVCSNLLLDFPGFGNSPPPTEVWGTRQYADHVAAWLKTIPCRKRIWIGHSFGCRVGIQLASAYPELVDGLFLIAAAGLPPVRSLPQRIKIKFKVYCYKVLKMTVALGLSQEWLTRRFGSQDYINAGEMRPIFIKTISEDLTETAKLVQCPVRLIYGINDTETPPGIGKRFEKLIPNASLALLPRYDHISILMEGRHQVLHQLASFIEKVAR